MADQAAESSGGLGRSHQGFTDQKCVEAGISQQLDEFFGAVSFTIDRGGEVSEICGLGVPDATGVRFQEKDVAHTGKDVRTWEVSQAGVGEFVAVPISPV